MRIRVEFERGEQVKFLGHLDVMRFFQRCFNRANVKMLYSEGFNPHMKMNFAQPLNVGMTSRGDYFDAEIEEGQAAGDVFNALCKVCGESFKIAGVYEVAENAAKCMTAVKYASYEITFEGECPEVTPFNEAASVITVKKTKSGEKTVDIKPMVHELTKEGNVIRAVVDAGGDNNLRADLLISELCKMNGMETEDADFGICRTGLYAEGFIPLSKYQVV